MKKAKLSLNVFFKFMHKHEVVQNNRNSYFLYMMYRKLYKRLKEFLIHKKSKNSGTFFHKKSLKFKARKNQNYR